MYRSKTGDLTSVTERCRRRGKEDWRCTLGLHGQYTYYCQELECLARFTEEER